MFAAPNYQTTDCSICRVCASQTPQDECRVREKNPQIEKLDILIVIQAHETAVGLGHWEYPAYKPCRFGSSKFKSD